ncbi:transcription termination/antitermination protein NusG [Acidobacteriota bacterium]
MTDWYVLNTKPKKEFQVQRLFEEGGFTVYNPKYKQDNRSLAFFPGYEFIQFVFPDQYKMVKYTRGVKQIVGNQNGPIPIDEQVILKIKEREVDGFVELEKYGKEPELGDEIEVVAGPLKGLTGIFKKETSNTDRVLILLNYVSYQGQMIVDKSQLKKVVK